MARQTTADKLPTGAPTAAVTDAPPAPRVQRGTATTPTAPLGTAVVAPVVEQVDEGGDQAQEVRDPANTSLYDDREWLTSQLRHLIGCPIEHLPFHAEDGLPSRSTRIDITDQREPRHQDRPFPRVYRVIQCNECGARARVRLPRNDDD